VLKKPRNQHRSGRREGELTLGEEGGDEDQRLWLSYTLTGKKRGPDSLNPSERGEILPRVYVKQHGRSKGPARKGGRPSLGEDLYPIRKMGNGGSSGCSRKYSGLRRLSRSKVKAVPLILV